MTHKPFFFGQICLVLARAASAPPARLPRKLYAGRCIGYGRGGLLVTFAKVLILLALFLLLVISVLEHYWVHPRWWDYTGDGGAAKRVPELVTTISSDGRMVAAMELKLRTSYRVLHVRLVDTDTRWRSIVLPPYTNSIRFGLRGHELLLAHNDPDNLENGFLSKLDLDYPERGVQRLHEAQGLAFPVEVAPDQFLVRGEERPVPKMGTSYIWLVLGPGERFRRVARDFRIPYGAPEIVGDGFFWVDPLGVDKTDVHPRVAAYPLPGGTAPYFPREKLEISTWQVSCDRQGMRCLRNYQSNYGKPGGFIHIYDVEVMLGTERCAVPGVAGFGEDVTITPDGNAAVMSLAPSHKEQRHVAVMRFKPGQCAALSVQHFYLNER